MENHRQNLYLGKQWENKNRLLSILKNLWRRTERGTPAAKTDPFLHGSFVALPMFTQIENYKYKAFLID